MQDGPLDDALETERRLRVDVVLAGNSRRVLVDEITQILAQGVVLAPQARMASAADGLSISASRRCSTVMNSWRFDAPRRRPCAG